MPTSRHDLLTVTVTAFGLGDSTARSYPHDNIHPYASRQALASKENLVLTRAAAPRICFRGVEGGRGGPCCLPLHGEDGPRTPAQPQLAACLRGRIGWYVVCGAGPLNGFGDIRWVRTSNRLQGPRAARGANTSKVSEGWGQKGQPER
ncbi:hypothetical protein BT67DRAFT_283921 [Trichocladium antarcticum]|uniref:Uncharacterized protein n=1 Tax=Trichocladium antarcticum TaxID=1450529 RepID=A0AAN6UKT3_9PEZI|nr:hypothetical protein BT67DRAFT_283921 [Trichocladium antarcticum]